LTDRSRSLFRVIVLLAIVLAGHLLVPFNRDNNLYQSMGFHLVRYGRLPYLGTFDQNFPGIVYIHAATIAVLGNSEFAFILVDTLCKVLIGVLLYLLLRRWFDERTATISALLSAVFCYIGGYWQTGQREVFALPFILLAVLSYYRYVEDRRGSVFFGSLAIGLLISCATVIRPTNILFGLVLLAASLYKARRLSIIPPFLFGIASLWVLILFPYLLIPQGFERFYNSTIRFNLDVYAAPQYQESFWYSFHKPQEMLADVVLLLGIALLIVFRIRNTVWKNVLISRPSLVDIYLWIGLYIAARIPVIVMGKYLGYHYVPIIILSVVIVAIWINVIANILPSFLRIPFIATVFVALVLCFYPWHYVQLWYEAIEKGIEHPLEYAHSARSLSPIDSLESEEYEIARYVNRPENRRGKVESCAMFAGLYWKSEREPASAFTTIVPLELRGNGQTPSYQLQWRREFMDSLRSAKPRFIILSHSMVAVPVLLSEPPADFLHRLPGFDSLLASDYQLDTAIRTWDIYGRRSFQP
jgi:4-amino-4-deoxy-L-arabinose transferase-like glycosyltransferase